MSQVNATTMLAVSDKGRFLHLPDIYEKTDCRPGRALTARIDLNLALDVNLNNIATALNKLLSQLTIHVGSG